MRSDESAVIDERRRSSHDGVDDDGRGAFIWRYLVCLCVAALLVRLLGPAWQTGFPAAFPDSASYLAAADAGVLSTNFWFGQRPPTYPLLIVLVGPSERAVVVAQTLLAVASWGWLLATAWTMLRTRWVAPLVLPVFVLIATQTRWLFWHTALLTESLSSTLAVAGIAAWWRWWAEPTKARTVVATGITVAWMLLRDSNAVTTGLVAAPTLVVVIMMARRRGSARRRRMALALAVVLLAGAYSTTAQLVSDRGETSFHNNVALRWLPDADMTAWMEARGMPVTPALLERAGADAWSDDEAMLRSPRLDDYRQWADGSGRIAAAASFVVRADWYVPRWHGDLARHLESDLLAYDTFGVAMHFPERPLSVIDPTGSRTAAAAWLALTVGAHLVLWFRRPTQAWFGVFLVVPVLVDAYLVYVADAVEVGRHLVGPMLRYSVVVVVVVAIAVDALIADTGTDTTATARDATIDTAGSDA